uniref:Zinc finger MYM-type protein 1-like n=1 Tax=Tanacetum cinerariifolium TaxID=118510 RepID=A0A6L2M5H1_TANCI|nr:zinc finger MYM-type protein 1-like [Tanacetum cinerariifolium]
MIDCLSTAETDTVIHTVETDIMKLVVEIECFDMSFDEFDKETRSSDGLQPKQADLSCVHALNGPHLHDIHVSLTPERIALSARVVIDKLEWEIIRSVLHRGIGETANAYDLHAWEVNEIVSKGIQDHQDIVKSHQHTIAELQKRMEEKEPINERKSGQAKANASSGNDHNKCYRCRKSGHVARDCDIDYCNVCHKSGHKASNCSNNVGCYKCGKIGHMSWDCKPVWNEGRCGGVCYYCGLRGYKSVCSLCGETGHLGKDCWIGINLDKNMIGFRDVYGIPETIPEPIPKPRPIPSSPDGIDLGTLPWDSPERSSIFSYDVNIRDEIRRKYLRNGACQLRGHKFPKRTIGTKVRSFVAKILFGNKDGNDAFVTDGFNSWSQKYGMSNHQSEGESREYHIRLKISVETCRFLLKAGLPFSAHDEKKYYFNRGLFLELYDLLSNQNEETMKVVARTPLNCTLKSLGIQKDNVNVFQKSGVDNEDVNEHIKKFLEIVDLFHIHDVTEDQLMLRVFPMSLTGAASRWLRNEPAGSIDTWETLKKKLLSKYCPPARIAKKMEEINNF